MKIVSCFCPLVLSTCHNKELLIAYPFRPLCFKNLRTTTTATFLISNTVVPNPYSHSAAFDPQSLAPFSKVQGSFSRSVSVWHSVHYSLQIGNGILQCVNRNRTVIFLKKFVVYGQYIGFTTLLLISIFQKMVLLLWT